MTVKKMASKDFEAFKSLYETSFFSCQGCQIFLGTAYQNGKNVPK
jgi:hypothetical protein